MLKTGRGDGADSAEPASVDPFLPPTMSRFATPISLWRPAFSTRCFTIPASKARGPAPLLRELMRSVAQPVAVITVALPSSLDPLTAPHNHGATLSSLSSISLSPPLVAFSLRLPSRLASFLLEPSPTPPRLRVHLLSYTQENLARTFARQAPLPAPASPSPPPSATAPSEHFPPSLFAELAGGSLGSLECTIVRSLPLSELRSLGEGVDARSELFIARVESVELPVGEAALKQSLVYWEQGYHAVGSA